MYKKSVEACTGCCSSYRGFSHCPLELNGNAQKPTIYVISHQSPCIRGITTEQNIHITSIYRCTAPDSQSTSCRVAIAHSGRANWRKSKLAEERIGGLGGKQECGRRGQPTIRLIRRPPGLRSQLPARRPSVNPLNLRELHIRESFIYKALQHPFNPQAAWPPKSATCASAIR